MDPRTERTVAAIRAAVLALAAESPIETATVADVARLAEVTRPTFYNHATSPTEVLISALGEELRAAGAAFRFDTTDDGTSRREAFVRNVNRVWEHINRHEAIYRAGLGPRMSPALHTVLTTHLEAQLRSFLTEDLPLGLAVPTPEDLETLKSLYTAQAAHGAVGIIETWLRLDPRPDRDLLVLASTRALPDWWFETEV
ncbi:MAG: TetR/AcrR family transcriptional regulator [Leucobacter sp.]